MRIPRDRLRAESVSDTSNPTLRRWPKTELGLLRFCPHLDEPSLELLGLDAVLAATTLTSADAALGGPHVFGSLLKHHCRQDRETGTPRSAAWNAPPTDYLENLKHAIVAKSDLR